MIAAAEHARLLIKELTSHAVRYIPGRPTTRADRNRHLELVAGGDVLDNQKRHSPWPDETRRASN